MRMTIKPVRGAVALIGTVVTLAAHSPASAQSGAASWYASGHRTANGEHFNPNGMTAAHRSLPFGTRVRVENKRNGRSVVVRINDRGPFVRGRIIDLAKGSARALGMGGTTYVSLRVVD
ncbi:septal ring lytic transglycosylase RlpA family protein [Methylobacterium sp. J-078]|nr:septal ring lytic transglycosylase RlpA family protein [Methylobacterium sp. J-078]MCJ2045335.1 septal ring lytic transglycosylase RlpA family protein [Methylobacterium sp. J-078]